VHLYDQLDVISGHDDLVGEHAHPHYCEQLSRVLKEEPAGDMGRSPSFDEETAILRDCAAALHDVYDMQLWADLKHIQYGLNWKVLESVLPRYSHSTALSGEDAALNKNLLGLLNRLVSIGKKSCPRLPMQDRHIDFVLDIVRKKYCQEDIDRSISHIAQCLRNGIDCYSRWMVNWRRDSPKAKRTSSSPGSIHPPRGPAPDGTGEKTGVKKVQGFKGSRVQE
jgi:hypothetical protein